jgi:hypothetical protein
MLLLFKYLELYLNEFTFYKNFRLKILSITENVFGNVLI